MDSRTNSGPYYGPEFDEDNFPIIDHDGNELDEANSTLPEDSYMTHVASNSIPQESLLRGSRRHVEDKGATFSDARRPHSLGGEVEFSSSVYPEPPIPSVSTSHHVSTRSNVGPGSINRSMLLDSIFDMNDPTTDPDYDTSTTEGERGENPMSQVELDESGTATSRRARRGGRGRGRPRGRGRANRSQRGVVGRAPQGDKRLTNQNDEPIGPRTKVRVVDYENSRVRSKRKSAIKPIEPSPAFKESLKRATTAFMDEDFEHALEYARAAVKINPEIFAAHSLLSEVLHNMGREADSVGALFSGAHVKRDPQVWWHVIDRTEQIPGITRQQIIDQVRYCLQRIIKLDPMDYDCRAERLRMMLESNQTSAALKECVRMLKIRPDDSDILRTAAQVAISLNSGSSGDRGEGCKLVLGLYEDRINEYIAENNENGGEVTWSLVNIYLDLLDCLKQYQEGCQRLKTLARWLCGRDEEFFWDDYDDDREWDVDDEPRRTETPEFVVGKYLTGAYGEALPLELRVKLGAFRLHMGAEYESEAFNHLEYLVSDSGVPQVEVSDYDDLLLEAGDALRECGYHTKALLFYELLLPLSDRVNSSYYRSLSLCYKAIGDTSRALDAQETVVALSQEDDVQRIELIKLYQHYGMHEEADRYIVKMFTENKKEKLRSSGIKYGKAVKHAGHDTRADLTYEDRVRKSVEKQERRKRKEEEKRQRLEERKRKQEERRRKRDERRQDAGSNSQEEYSESEDDDSVQDVGIIKSKNRAGRRKKRKEDPEKGISRNAEDIRDIKSRQALQRLEDLQQAVDSGDREALDDWMENANTVIVDFRGVKPLNPPRDRSTKFPGFSRKSRDPAAMRLAERAEVEHSIGRDTELEMSYFESEHIPDEFRGVSFDRWVEIFCQYAMYSATEFGDRERSYETLQAALYSNVFHHVPHRIIRLHFCRLACAIFFSDEQMIIDEARWFIKDAKSPYKFASDSFRLWSLTSRLFNGHRTWYNSGPSQKFVLRQIKALDFALLDPAQRATFGTAQERDSWTNCGANDGNPHGVSEHDPGLLALYGHVLAVGGAYAQALNYYFRAYAVSPEDPMINFCIASSFLHHAIKRHSENRQYQLQQGLAFMLRYHELRTKENIGVHVQEAEFNLARTWHSLGVVHLALPGYERVLKVSERVRREYEEKNQEDESLQYEDLASEAAFAMRSILAVGGDLTGARRVTEKWMVI